MSAIVGLFSRVPAAALLLRALGLGLAFAALAYGAILLARQFLPELFADCPESAAPEPAYGEPVGAHVDITLQGGEPSYPGLESLEPAEGEVGDVGDEPRDMEVVQARAAPAQSANQESLIREVEDLRGESILPPEDKPVHPAPQARPSVGPDEIDVLPDLESMSDSFAVELPPSNDGPVFDGARSGGGDGMDPAMLAKAVQTLIKRDSKG